MQRLAFFVVCLTALARPGAAFCPYGCGCDESNSAVTCIRAELEVMPISLNPSIRSLILKYNDFHTVDASFNFYPELEMVDLSHNKIISIPDRAFKAQKKLKELRLNNNEISELTPATLAGLRKLESLDFSSNFLQMLSASSFLDLESLEMLDLGNNSISQIEEEAFVGLFSLKILRLDDNNLVEIPGVLRYLPELVELTLNRNKIKTIVDSALPLPNLSVLDLSSNSIEKLHEKSFSELLSLKTLKLNDNNLFEIPDSVMYPLAAVEELLIGQNRFSSISTGWLSELTKLRVLDVSGCPELRTIEKEAFSPNKGLESVSISSNRLLGHIDPKAFSGLANLVQLDLSSNALESIPTSLVPWWNLKYLQVSGNPLHCDCTSYFLKEVIYNLVNNSSSQNVRVVRCWTPLHLRDQDLATLNLDCKLEAAEEASGLGQTMETALIIALVASTLVIFLVLLAAFFIRQRYMKKKLGRGSGSTPTKVKDILQYSPAMTHDTAASGTMSTGSPGGEPRYVSVRPNIVANPYMLSQHATASDHPEKENFIRHEQYFATLARLDPNVEALYRSNNVQHHPELMDPRYYYATNARGSSSSHAAEIMRNGQRLLSTERSLAANLEPIYAKDPVYYAVSSAVPSASAANATGGGGGHVTSMVGPRTATLVRIDPNTSSSGSSTHYEDPTALF